MFSASGLFCRFPAWYRTLDFNSLSWWGFNLTIVQLHNSSRDTLLLHAIRFIDPHSLTTDRQNETNTKHRQSDTEHGTEQSWELESVSARQPCFIFFSSPAIPHVSSNHTLSKYLPVGYSNMPIKTLWHIKHTPIKLCVAQSCTSAKKRRVRFLLQVKVEWHDSERVWHSGCLI